MLVKIKILKIEHETDKALLCKIKGCCNKWLPKQYIKYTRYGSTLIPIWLATEKDIPYKDYTHIPKKIEPKFNQEPINELKY